MNSNKGFTLVELLAVLVILIAILSIAVPSVISTVERNKQKDLEKKKKIIISAAETFNALDLGYNSWYTKRDFFSGSCGYDISFLLHFNLLAETEAKDNNGNYIECCVMYDTTNKKYLFENNYCTEVCNISGPPV